MSNTKVYVIDAGEKPLLPTTPARARFLLKKGKAMVYSVLPFTIKLNRIINNPVGEFKCGIDDGAKVAGIAISGNDEVVFACNIELRQDVNMKMTQRASCRRTRRSRKLRHRETRFKNRGKKGWIPPTIKQKKDSVLRVIDFMKKRLNITECVVEQGQFDTSSMSKGRKLCGVEYQVSEYEGKNWRQKVLWRDKYTCQNCKETEDLQAHHIIYRSKEGNNSVSNGITLCSKCHEDLHRGSWILSIKPKRFNYPAHLQQGKGYLFNELKKRISVVKIIYGWMTSELRKKLLLAKDHYTDAMAMLETTKITTTPYIIKPRRTKIWDNNPTKQCEEKCGFRHYDVVKAINRNKGVVIGSIRSLKSKEITLRTKFDNNFAVSYNKSQLLYRPSGLIFIQMEK